MDTKTILNEASARMQKAIDYLEESLLNVRAGKASLNVLNGVFVDYYGSQTPVSGVASVTVPDAKTVLIQPWDKNMIRAIEKAILDSNIGLTPSNNGEQIRLTMPPVTEERRKELVKQVRAEAETARVSLRNARRDAVEAFKKAMKEGMARMANFGRKRRIKLNMWKKQTCTTRPPGKSWAVSAGRGLLRTQRSRCWPT